MNTYNLVSLGSIEGAKVGRREGYNYHFYGYLHIVSRSQTLMRGGGGGGEGLVNCYISSCTAVSYTAVPIRLQL